MRAVARLLGLAQAAVAVAHALGNPAPPQHVITFEAWNDTAQSPENALMALEAAKTGDCITGQLNVLVRMSTCFSPAELVKIDTWVHDTLVPAGNFYSQGAQFQLNYVGNLVDKKAGSTCPTTTMSNEAQWRGVRQFMGYGQVDDPVVVITLTKGTTQVLGLLESQLPSAKLGLDI